MAMMMMGDFPAPTAVADYEPHAQKQVGFQYQAYPKSQRVECKGRWRKFKQAKV